MDIIAARVHGVVQARDCRVIWEAGNLYVCKSPQDIIVIVCPELKKVSGSYKTLVGEGQIRIQPPGCGSCRRRVQESPIGQMSAADIIASVASIDA